MKQQQPTTRLNRIHFSAYLLAGLIVVIGLVANNFGFSSNSKQSGVQQSDQVPTTPVTKVATQQTAEDQEPPATTKSAIPDLPKAGPRVTVKKEPILTRNGKTYNPAQLHKNATLLLLAAQPDIRAKLVLAPFRTVMDEKQKVQAMSLAMANNQQFDQLLRERAAVLENAFDGKDVEAQLLDIKMRTSDLLTATRNKLQKHVLTKAQRDEVVKFWAAQEKKDQR